jgi:hypothetical protein
MTSRDNPGQAQMRTAGDLTTTAPTPIDELLHRLDAPALDALDDNGMYVYPGRFWESPHQAISHDLVNRHRGHRKTWTHGRVYWIAGDRRSGKTTELDRIQVPRAIQTVVHVRVRDLPTSGNGTDAFTRQVMDGFEDARVDPTDGRRSLITLIDDLDQVPGDPVPIWAMLALLAQGSRGVIATTRALTTAGFRWLPLPEDIYPIQRSCPDHLRAVLERRCQDVVDVAMRRHVAASAHDRIGRAIDIVRQAARLAADQGHDRVDWVHVDLAVDALHREGW